MKKKALFISSSFILLLIISIFSFSSSEYSDSISVLKNLKEKYTIYAIPKPTKNIFFADERVPLENSDIWERYDKELLKNTYWQSNTLLLYKRARNILMLVKMVI